MSVPMRIRIRWEHGSWWAYFNGWPNSYLHSTALSDLCNAIGKAFPRGTTAVADYETPEPPAKPSS